jgi:integrase/recombinase XerC
MLMAKSRHRKPENVRRYFHPSPEAIAEVIGLLAPGGGSRWTPDRMGEVGACPAHATPA